MLAALLCNLPSGGSSGVAPAGFLGGKSIIDKAVPLKGFRDLSTKHTVYSEDIDQEDEILMQMITMFLKG